MHRTRLTGRGASRPELGARSRWALPGRPGAYRDLLDARPALDWLDVVGDDGRRLTCGDGLHACGAVISGTSRARPRHSKSAWTQLFPLSGRHWYRVGTRDFYIKFRLLASIARIHPLMRSNAVAVLSADKIFSSRSVSRRAITRS